MNLAPLAQRRGTRPLAWLLSPRVLTLATLTIGCALPLLLAAPASAHHLMDLTGMKPGYALSGAVLGWEPTPIGFYLVGLLVSQSLLLLVALTAVRSTSPPVC